MPLSALDHRLLILARTRGHGPVRDRLMSAYSLTGEHAVCWLALGVVGATVDRSPPRRGQWRHGVGTVVAAYIVNTALKRVVRRPRPTLDGLPPLTPTLSGLSFPSAHATTAFAAARVYGRVLPAAPLYGLAVLFAVSRPYLGVHYPSDVLAGSLLGTLVAAVSTRGGALSTGGTALSTGGTALSTGGTAPWE